MKIEFLEDFFFIYVGEKNVYEEKASKIDEICCMIIRQVRVHKSVLIHTARSIEIVPRGGPPFWLMKNGKNSLLHPLGVKV